jgi:hypothetical protein
LPSGLYFLSLGAGFNQSVDNLPQTLKELHLSNPFNQPVNNLPSSLTTLSMRSVLFRQNIERLPVGISTVYLCYYVPENLFELLTNMQKLHMYYGFNHPTEEQEVDVKGLSYQKLISLKENIKLQNDIWSQLRLV